MHNMQKSTKYAKYATNLHKICKYATYMQQICNDMKRPGSYISQGTSAIGDKFHTGNKHFSDRTVRLTGHKISHKISLRLIFLLLIIYLSVASILASE